MMMARLLFAVALLPAFGAAFAGEQKPTPASAPVASPVSKPLDLRIPDISEIFTAQELAQILAKTFNDDIEGVEVRGKRVIERSATPNVWPGIAAPFWAIAHPAEAWRIFAPLPPDQTKLLAYAPPRATDTLLQPAAPMHP